MIDVMVADDHAIVRRGLRQILAETDDIMVGGEAATAEEVVELAAKRHWSVIVLDISLPGRNGIDLIKDIRRVRPGVPVLILTVHPENQYAVRAIKAGAAGFLNKEAAPEKLVEAVRRVAEGGRYVSAALAEMLASMVAGDSEAAPHDRLTDREFEVFKLLASGQTVSDVARKLSLSVKTISTHRTHILEKLELTNNAELMRYALDAGLTLPRPPQLGRRK